MIGTALDHPSAAWLTTVLRRRGHLLKGHVTGLAATHDDSTHSRITWLAADYSADAQGPLPLPRRLALKRCRNLAATFGPSEVHYYERDYVGDALAPLPRCFDAAYDEATGAYHLLLEDLRDTHGPCWDRMPDDTAVQGLADAVYALHRRHWGQVAPPSAEELDRYIGHLRTGLHPLLDAAQDELSDDDVQLLHGAFEHHPRLLHARSHTSQGMTLVHGDLNPGNILAPHAGAGSVYLIDRQPFHWSLVRWLGASDLAYAIVHWWPVAQRRRFEHSLLQRYHAHLSDEQRHRYPFAALWEDYRLCAVQSVYVAVEWCADPGDVERMRWLWLQQLKKALQALRDLKCPELW